MLAKVGQKGHLKRMRGEGLSMWVGSIPPSLHQPPSGGPAEHRPASLTFTLTLAEPCPLGLRRGSLLHTR